MSNNQAKKLRILFITSDKFPPFRPAARVIFGEELGKRGHVIDWLIQSDKNSNKAYRISYGNGIAYVAATDDGASRWRRARKYFLDFMNDLRIFRLVNRNKYDLIQVKDKYVGALIAIVAAKITSTPFVYWLAYPHAEASIYEVNEGTARYKYFYLLRGVFFKSLLYRMILPSADHVFVQSEQMKQDIAREGIPLDSMTPVPSTLSLSEIPYAESCGQLDKLKSRKNKEDKKVVYLGTLMRIRRLDFIIRVHAKVVKRHPSAKLILVGKGELPEDEKYLKEEAKKQGIDDSVVFTGHLPMKQAWEYIRDADVCLSPYYPTPILNSTSPTKLIEYMAMAKVVVGNDHPEQSHVISESRAGICVPWNEDAFASAISKLLDTPELAEDMGRNGREYVRKYRTNHVMASVIEEIYYSLCELDKV